MTTTILSLDESELVPKTIKLISKQGTSFEILVSDANPSKLIVAALEEDPSATEVPLPNVSTESLRHIVVYLQHHKGVEPPIVQKPIRSKNMKDNCKDEWDAKFIDGIDQGGRPHLYELIHAANYMDIKSLLSLGAAKIASLLKGESLDRIEKIINFGSV